MPSTRFARAIYWRAKPGQLQAYNDYLHEFVEPVGCDRFVVDE